MPRGERLNFAEVRHGVPIDAVLSRYGVETRKRNNTYLVANCPLPSHTSKESAFSFAINVEKNLWTCHSDSCQKGMGMKGGDVIDLVCLMEGTRTPLDGAKKLIEWFPQIGKPPDTGATRSVVVPNDAVNHTPVLETNKPLAFTLKDINHDHEMIRAKGISVETAASFGVGWFPGAGSMKGRIVFPLYEQGNLVGYAGRTVLDVTAENPKWKLPPIHKNFLYAIERCDPAKPLIVTESFWAPLWFHENGAQAAALMGNDLTDGQEKCLAPFKVICIALDNDDAGREATAKIAERLKPQHTVLKARLIE